MPVITVAMGDTSPEVKKELIASLTAAAAGATAIAPEKFIVFVEEYSPDAIGIAGRTLREIRGEQK